MKIGEDIQTELVSLQKAALDKKPDLRVLTDHLLTMEEATRRAARINTGCDRDWDPLHYQAFAEEDERRIGMWTVWIRKQAGLRVVR